jgi:DNA-binding CsgD family transcriptional regulator
LAARGRSSVEIGEHLHLSPRTVDTHLARVYRKLGITGRTELAAALAGTG